jgi:hypothetical protein
VHDHSGLLSPFFNGFQKQSIPGCNFFLPNEVTDAKVCAPCHPAGARCNDALLKLPGPGKNGFFVYKTGTNQVNVLDLLTGINPEPEGGHSRPA